MIPQSFIYTLADACQRHINAIAEGCDLPPISARNTGNGCYCPLGAITGPACRRPGPFAYGLVRLGVTPTQLSDFILGFDNGRTETEFARLGAAYRKRFP